MMRTSRIGATWRACTLQAILVSVCFLCGCGQSARISATDLMSSARATIVRYVHAIDRRDGVRVCSLLDSVVQAHFHLPTREGVYRCPRFLHAYIGTLLDSEPEWRSVALDGPPLVQLRGHLAIVTFYVTHQIVTSGPPPTPLREADTVILTQSGDGWKLATTGVTLAIASHLGFRDPHIPTPAQLEATTPEDAARAYVVSLSGGPPGICALLGRPGDQETCQDVSWAGKLGPSAHALTWQAAQIDRMTAQATSRAANVGMDLTETYLSASGALVDRRLHDTLSLRLVDGVWRPKEPSAVYFAASGRPPLPPLRAAQLPAGHTVAGEGALAVAGGPHGAGVLTFARLGNHNLDAVQLQVLRDGHAFGPPHLVAEGRRQPYYNGPFSEVTSAGDFAHGNVVVVWTEKDATPGVYAVAVDSAGQPVDRPIRLDVGTTARPLITSNPTLDRYFVSWLGEGANGYAGARILDGHGRPIAEAYGFAGQGGNIRSVAPTASGWLVATSSTGLNTTTLTALDANGRPVSTRHLHDHAASSLASTGTRHLLAWIAASGTTGPVKVAAQLVDSLGRAAGPQVTLAGPIGTAAAGSPDFRPLLTAATTSKFTVAWEQAYPLAVSFRQVSADARTLGPTHTFALAPVGGFQTGRVYPPELKLVPDDNRIWLLRLNQKPTNSAALIAIP